MADSGKAGKIAGAGVGPDEHELAELFDRHRDRLRRMVAAAARPPAPGAGRSVRRPPGGLPRRPHRAAEYAANPTMPFLPLAAVPHRPAAHDLHRHHLGAADARRRPGGLALPRRACPRPPPSRWRRSSWAGSRRPARRPCGPR